jgi:sugar lactone lactonase YvrE
VGEVIVLGPVWSAAEKALWFVDIKAPAIHRYDPATNTHVDAITTNTAP